MKIADAETTGPAVKLQAWWRMARTNTIYRERLKPVRMVAFVGGVLASLLIRVVVLIYVSTILYMVITSMDETEERQRSSSPANPEHLEQSVLYRLLVSNSNLGGYANIVACRCVLLSILKSETIRTNSSE